MPPILSPRHCHPHRRHGARHHGICIDPDDTAGFKMQIEDLPVYKNMGTNGKIPAGPPADLCRMARMFLEGIGAATATPAPTAAPEPATPAPAPFSDESQDPDAYRHYDLPN